MLKETAITMSLIGWKEDGKKKSIKNDTVVRALFVSKYKDLSYFLPLQSENDIDRTYFIQEDDIVWCRGRDRRFANAKT